MNMNLCMLVLINIAMASAQDVCTAIKSNTGLPSSCACALTDGSVKGKVTCTQPIDLGIGDMGKFSAVLAFDLAPCETPANIELTATMGAVSIAKKFDVSTPPGSVEIPLTDIGIPAGTFNVDYKFTAGSGTVAVQVKVDSCAELPGLGKKCFSDIDFKALGNSVSGLAVKAALTGVFGKIPEPQNFPLAVIDTSLDVAFCPVTTTAATSATACGTAVAAAVKDVDDAAFAKTQLLCTHLASGGCELAKAACQWKKSSWYYGSSYCSACSGACPARLTAGEDDDGNTMSALVEALAGTSSDNTNTNNNTSSADTTIIALLVVIVVLAVVGVGLQMTSRANTGNTLQLPHKAESLPAEHHRMYEAGQGNSISNI